VDLLTTVKALTGARRARRGRRIQSLWRGYGEVVLVHLEGGPAPTVVAKHVRPPAGAHPRKLRSYAVETHWYRSVAPELAGLPRCPAFHGASTDGDERIIVLEDLLGAGFSAPLPRGPGPGRTAALGWLAQLHASALGAPTTGLWPVGTYWHLETRQAELAATPDPRWRAEAPALDAALRGARFQTLVHGDAKPANFLWSPARGACAAVDFQYLGGGPGIRDVVYLLDVDDPEDPALEAYFRALRGALGPAVDAAALEAEWRALVPVAARDFQRFLAGWGRA
jgi:aminoglycoside phosphotransferase (APT) family kinase protein